MTLQFVSKDLIESLYAKYRENPSSVDREWWEYFQDLPPANGCNHFSYEKAIDAALYGEKLQKPEKKVAGSGKASVLASSLIAVYRFLGWKKAKLNPLQDGEIYAHELDPTSWDGWSQHATEKVELAGFGSLTLDDLLAKLSSIYGGTLGCEVSHMACKEERDFMLSWFEGAKADLSADKRKQIFTVLAHAVGFENFLHQKHRTAKEIWCGWLRGSTSDAGSYGT